MPGTTMIPFRLNFEYKKLRFITVGEGCCALFGDGHCTTTLSVRLFQQKTNKFSYQVHSFVNFCRNLNQRFTIVCRNWSWFYDGSELVVKTNICRVYLWSSAPKRRGLKKMPAGRHFFGGDSSQFFFFFWTCSWTVHELRREIWTCSWTVHEQSTCSWTCSWTVHEGRPSSGAGRSTFFCGVSRKFFFLDFVHTAAKGTLTISGGKNS